MKSAEITLIQTKKAGSFCTGERFYIRVFTVEDIQEDGIYYGGFMFILIITEYLFSLCIIAASDVSHFQGLGTQSYGTIFQVVVYN